MSDLGLLQNIFPEIKKYKGISIEKFRRNHDSLSCLIVDNQIVAVIIRNQKGLGTIDFPNLEALEYLNISDNEGLKSIHFAGNFPELVEVYLSDNNLNEIRFPENLGALEYLYLNGNELVRFHFNNDHLPNLKLLDISQNKLSELDLPEGLLNLKYLYLNENQLTHFKPKATLPKLDTLGLKNNAFEVLPLNFLEPLYNLKSLYLQDNPLPNPPKISIDSQSYQSCLEVVKRYFIDCAKGMKTDNECKVLLVGNGNVGKSCFVIRLTENRFEKDWKSTHAINLQEYPYGKYLLNLWDFAGQDIYHATHRLFMQRDAVYLIMWDKDTESKENTARREGEEWKPYDNYSLQYWLHYCLMLGKNSPAIVVQTKVGKDAQNKKDCPEIREEFKDKFSYLDFKHIESKETDWEDTYYDELLLSIKKALRRTKKMTSIPKGYFDIREKIREKQKVKDENREKTLDIADYQKMVAGLVEDPIEVLENWLTKTGVVFYSRSLFENKIILDQDWAIKAVYSLFNPDSYFYSRMDNPKNKGQFSGKHLAKDWGNFKESEQALFVSFMLQCELCFETTQKNREYHHISFEERTFVAPQFLPMTLPERVQEIREDWEEETVQWHIRYEYPILHYGIIQSFIIRTQALSPNGCIWRQGIYLKENRQKAIIEADRNKRTILVQVSKNSKDLLDKVRNLLELLQDGIGVEMVSADGVNFVSLQNLKDSPDGNAEVRADNTNKWIPKESLKQFLEKDEKNVFQRPTELKILERIKSFKNKIKKLLGENEYEEAIEILKELDIEETFETGILELERRHNILKQKEINGTISTEDTILEKNKLSEKIISLINELLKVEEKIGEKGAGFFHPLNERMLQMHKDLVQRLDSIGENLVTVLEKLNVIDRNLIENLNISTKAKKETAKSFIRLEEKMISPAAMEELSNDINSMMEKNLAQLPDDIAKTWKVLNTKAAGEADLKGKFKMKIPIIPAIIHYEKELTFDLKKIAKEIHRKGIIF